MLQDHEARKTRNKESGTAALVNPETGCLDLLGVEGRIAPAEVTAPTLFAHLRDTALGRSLCDKISKYRAVLEPRSSSSTTSSSTTSSSTSSSSASFRWDSKGPERSGSAGHEFLDEKEHRAKLLAADMLDMMLGVQIRDDPHKSRTVIERLVEVAVLANSWGLSDAGVDDLSARGLSIGSSQLRRLLDNVSKVYGKASLGIMKGLMMKNKALGLQIDNYTPNGGNVRTTLLATNPGEKSANLMSQQGGKRSTQNMSNALVVPIDGLRPESTEPIQDCRPERANAYRDFDQTKVSKIFSQNPSAFKMGSIGKHRSPMHDLVDRVNRGVHACAVAIRPTAAAAATATAAIPTAAGRTEPGCIDKAVEASKALYLEKGGARVRDCHPVGNFRASSSKRGDYIYLVILKFAVALLPTLQGLNLDIFGCGDTEYKIHQAVVVRALRRGTLKNETVADFIHRLADALMVFHTEKALMEPFFSDVYAQVTSLSDIMIELMKHAKAKYVEYKKHAQQVIDLTHDSDADVEEEQSPGAITTVFDEVTDDGDGGSIEAPAILESETVGAVLDHLAALSSATDVQSTMDHPDVVAEAEAVHLVQQVEDHRNLGRGCRKRKRTDRYAKP